MLSNRIVLITGAASGIGLETAKLFAKEGASVIAVDLNEKVQHIVNELDRQYYGQRHVGYVVDVSKSNQVYELFKNINETYETQTPSIIVNCAGILKLKPFLEMSEEDFDQMLNVHLKGTFLVTQCAVKELVKHFDESKHSDTSTYGSIINISSIAALVTLGYETARYNTAKAAIEAFTRSIAKELGQYKIRANSIAPGYIETPMSAIIDYLAEIIKDNAPLKRIGKPIEIAELCLFLASDKSSYMTGSLVKADGGFTC